MNRLQSLTLILIAAFLGCMVRALPFETKVKETADFFRQTTTHGYVTATVKTESVKKPKLNSIIPDHPLSQQLILSSHVLLNESSLNFFTNLEVSPHSPRAPPA